MSNPPSLSWKCCYGCRWLKMEGNSLMRCRSLSRTLAACWYGMFVQTVHPWAHFYNTWRRLATLVNCQAIFMKVRNSHRRLRDEPWRDRLCMRVALRLRVLAEHRQLCRQDLVSSCWHITLKELSGCLTHSPAARHTPWVRAKPQGSD